MHINVVVIGHVDSGKSTTTGKPTSNTTTPSTSLSNNSLTIYNRSLDLQVRWNWQAYHREVREGKNISLLSQIYPSPLCLLAGLIAKFAPRWGIPQSIFLRPSVYTATPRRNCCPTTTQHFTLSKSTPSHHCIVASQWSSTCWLP